ncbi:MAG: carbohydrate binding family 9 domain-containing protein [Phycisphaeraceae bacterium]|nr:carbohydrate binding family 9 domain-containing protein [Phycisphaeraceae bacterium]
MPPTPDHPGRRRAFVLSVALVIGAIAPEVAAQLRESGEPGAVARRPPPVSAILRTDAPPLIDGVLDDEVWAEAPVIDGFRQVDPVEGAEPSQRTEVRLLYDDDNLYVGVHCFDDDPGAIVAQEMQRDAALANGDLFSFVIDTFNDQRNGYFFETNPLGARVDGLIDQGRDIRTDWDGIWRAEATIDDTGWHAEFAIPFKTVSFDPARGDWGFNAERYIRRTNEDIRWAAISNSRGVASLADAGVIEGLEGLKQGLGVDVKPFVTVSTRGDGSHYAQKTLVEPGVDIFWKPDPSLTFVATFNTDFAETDVDDRQINLTRFPLFFPEKRDFFLQDAGIFRFGGLGRTPLPFFSRRIGIGPSGEEQEILAGVKVTGRADGFNYGLLDVQMKHDEALGDKNLTVARGLWNVGEESTAGVIVTNGAPRTRGSNSLVGLDFNYRNSTDFGSDTLRANLWMQLSTSSGDAVVGDHTEGTAFGSRLAYESDDFDWTLIVEQTGESFNPALGFVARPDIREYFARGRKRWRPVGSVWRRIDLGVNLNTVTDLSNVIESQSLTVPQVSLVTDDGDGIDLDITVNRERLFTGFEIMDGVVIDPGDYWFTSGAVGAYTSSGRPLSVSGSVRIGEFYDGSGVVYFAGATWRPTPNIRLSGNYTINDIDLPAGDFITRLLRVQMNIAFSTDVTWNNTVQYDNVSDSVGINSRLRWEVVPGDEVFFVVNQGFDAEDGRFRSLSTALTFKLGLTFRY